MNLLQPVISAVGQILPQLWAGKKIQPYNSNNIISIRKRNEEVAVLNALLNLSVNPPTAGDWRYSDSGVQLDLSRFVATSSSSGGVNYAGLYSTANNYALDDLVYVGTDPTRRYWYICEIANTSASPQVPDSTETASPLYWRLICAPNVLQRFRIKSVQGDYLTCHTYDGTTEGSTNIYVAKPYKLRQSLTGVTFNSVTYTYSYAAGPDANNIFRTSTPSVGSAETQLVIPPWIVNDEMFAMPADTGVIGGGGSATKLMMVQDNRQWAKQ